MERCALRAIVGGIENHTKRNLSIRATEFKALGADDLLAKSVECLLGITALGKQALATMGIVTVFDLASSQTFATANEMVAAELAVSTGLARYGRVPKELVDDDARATRLTDLPLKNHPDHPQRRALDAGSVSSRTCTQRAAMDVSLNIEYCFERDEL